MNKQVGVAYDYKEDPKFKPPMNKKYNQSILITKQPLSHNIAFTGKGDAIWKNKRFKHN